jgi:hypothetical protein
MEKEDGKGDREFSASRDIDRQMNRTTVELGTKLTDGVTEKGTVQTTMRDKEAYSDMERMSEG